MSPARSRARADVEVRADDRERKPGERLEQRVDAVVELVVADRGGRDRQVGTSVHGRSPRRGYAGLPMTKSPRSSQIVGWRSSSRSSRSATPAHVPLSP